MLSCGTIRLFLALFLTALAGATIAHASPEGITTKDPALRPFVGEITRRLPPGLLVLLDRPVLLEFRPLNPAGLRDICASGITQTRGKAIRPRSSAKPYRIVLDSSFLEEAIRGEEGSPPLDCGHGNLYRLALATALHELAHLYDKLGPRTAAEKATLEYCREQAPKGDRKNERRCRGFSKLSRTVSSRSSYQRLVGWKPGFFDEAVPKSALKLRSPDPYEYKNIEEHFAVNFEYFLLDPQFACRRPSLNRYLEAHFGFQPFVDPAGQRSCEMQPFAYVSSSDIARHLGGFASLDPERVYAVHYLLATQGEEMMSRWGHAMLRLVICRPGRPPGPDCMKDDLHHLVISYRANVSDIVINSLKGLLGGYPSQLFLYRLDEIIDEYTRGELRDLISVPIPMTEGEKHTLLSRVLEQAWEYSGNYYFLTNNCATEVRDLLKATLPGSSAEARAGELSSISPTGLYASLTKLKLVDPSILGNRKEALHTGYLYESKAREYDILYRNLHAAGAPFKDWRDLEKKLSPAERRTLYQTLLDKRPENARALSSSFTNLENYAGLRARKELDSAILEFVEGLPASALEQDPKLARFAELLGIRRTLTAWSALKRGYGVPTFDELGEIQDQLTEAERRRIQKEVTDVLEKNFPALGLKLAGIRGNQDFFKSEAMKK